MRFPSSVPEGASRARQNVLDFALQTVYGGPILLSPVLQLLRIVIQIVKLIPVIIVLDILESPIEDHP